MKFWPDSSEKLGMEWDESLIIRTNVNKMVVDIRDRFVQHEVPLSQFYHLSYKNEGSVSITGINGYKKLEVLMGKIFRKNYLKKDGADHAAVFLEASKIVPYMRICTIERQHGISFLDETINAIQQDLM